MRQKGFSKSLVLIILVLATLLLLSKIIMQPVLRSLKTCLAKVNTQYQPILNKYNRHQITKDQVKEEYLKFRQDFENCRDKAPAEAKRPRIVVDFVIKLVR